MWNSYTDLMRDELWQRHREVNIVDFSFYNVDVFNQCENSNDVLMAIDEWRHVHPLLKIIPIKWPYHSKITP